MLMPTIDLISTNDFFCVERCVSTAMTDIIDEILNTPRSKSPYKGDGSPRRRLPDSLVREIHEEWEKASQSTGLLYDVNNTLKTAEGHQRLVSVMPWC